MMASSTASASSALPGAKPRSFAMESCIFEIQRVKITASAPPSGAARVDKLRSSSRYVASPCPLEPASLRSGERSASATANPRSIACERMSWIRKLLPDPYLPEIRRKALPPDSTTSRSPSMAAISCVLPIAMYSNPVRGTTPAAREFKIAPETRFGISCFFRTSAIILPLFSIKLLQVRHGVPQKFHRFPRPV